MKPLLAAILPLFLICPALAEARECSTGSDQVLTPVDWRAEINQRASEAIGLEYVTLSFTFRNELDTGVRMVEGMAIFDDVLGRSITNISIDEDPRIPAGQEYDQSGDYSSSSISRLSQAHRDDIRLTICVEAVVLDNGEVRRFDE